MSEIINDPNLEQDVTDEGAEEKKKGFFASLNVYDAMLALALLFVILATIRLFFVLRVYSSSYPFGGAPWNASEFQWLMWF